MQKGSVASQLWDSYTVTGGGPARAGLPIKERLTWKQYMILLYQKDL
jgi:hypothetical protein